jgi:hypothetical protein
VSQLQNATPARLKSIVNSTSPATATIYRDAIVVKAIGADRVIVLNEAQRMQNHGADPSTRIRRPRMKIDGVQGIGLRLCGDKISA